MKAGPGKYPVGVNARHRGRAGRRHGQQARREAGALYGAWLTRRRKSDFVGVQTYTRARVGKDGDLPPDPGAELTQMGYEF